MENAVEVWDRARRGKHTVVLGLTLPEPPPELRVLRVSCDVPPSTLGPLLEARDRVERVLGTSAPFVEMARARVITGLRRHLLGDLTSVASDGSLVDVFNRFAALGPAVLVLDAAEAADASSLDMLRHILGRPGWLRLPFVLAMRAEPLPAAAASLVEAVRAAAGDDAVLRSLAEAGVPSARTVASLPPAAPPLDLRVLPADVLRVLRTLSIAGSGCEAPVLAAVLESSEIAVLEALQLAADAGVPVEDRGEGRFHLPQATLDELRASILPSLAAALHRRVAAILAHEQPPVTARIPSLEPQSDEARRPGDAWEVMQAEPAPFTMRLPASQEAKRKAEPPAEEEKPLPTVEPPAEEEKPLPTVELPAAEEQILRTVELPSAEETIDSEPDAPEAVAARKPAAPAVEQTIESVPDAPAAAAIKPAFDSAGQEAAGRAAREAEHAILEARRAAREEAERAAAERAAQEENDRSVAESIARAALEAEAHSAKEAVAHAAEDVAAVLAAEEVAAREATARAEESARAEKAARAAQEAAAVRAAEEAALSAASEARRAHAARIEEEAAARRAAEDAAESAVEQAQRELAAEQRAAYKKPFTGDARPGAPSPAKWLSPLAREPDHVRDGERRARPPRIDDDARAARHLAAAGDAEAAIERYFEAMQRAAGAAAYPQAVAHAQAALALLDRLPATETHRLRRVQILLEAGRVLWHGAGPDESFTLQGALRVLETARAALHPDDPAELVAEVAVLIAGVLQEIGDLESLSRALEELTAASRALAQNGKPQAAARLFNDQAGVFMRLGDPVRAAHLLTESRKIFEPASKTDRVAMVEMAETDHLFARLMLHVPARPGREDDALSLGIDHAIAAERAFRRLGAPREVGRVLETMGRLELRKDRLDRAAERLSAAIQIQESMGDVVGLAQSTAALSEVLAAGGQMREALSLVSDSIVLNFEKGSPLGLAQNRSALAALAQNEQLRARSAELLATVKARLGEAEKVVGRIPIPGNAEPSQG